MAKKTPNLSSLKPIGMVLSAGLAASLATIPTANATAFSALQLTQGYRLAENHAAPASPSTHEQGAAEMKSQEGKCGEGKCGEGKCGSNMKSDSHAKAKEGKCGEGKCGEGKCGSNMAPTNPHETLDLTQPDQAETPHADTTHIEKPTTKSAEGKCGEGKCGEGKCGS